MKRMKKLFAILMTMAMVMGLGITGFAAQSVDIVIENLEVETSVKAVQVIEPDSTKETGWAFVDNADIKSAYATAFNKSNPSEEDYQDIIWALIAYVDKDNPNLPEGTIAATADQIDNALKAIEDATYDILLLKGEEKLFL